MTDSSALSVDDQGRLHVERLQAVPDPASLVEVRRQVNGMLPRFDLPEVVLEVMAWEPRVRRRVHRGVGGPDPPGRPAREHRRLSHRPRPQHRLWPDRQERCRGPRTRPGQPCQPDLPGRRDLLARQRVAHSRPRPAYRSPRRWEGAWWPPSTACASSCRVPSIYARPNRKYFGPKRGVTWLNMLNDQGAGTGAKVVSGTERDSLHMIDTPTQTDVGVPQGCGRRRRSVRPYRDSSFRCSSRAGSRPRHSERSAAPGA